MCDLKTELHMETPVAASAQCHLPHQKSTKSLPKETANDLI